MYVIWQVTILKFQNRYHWTAFFKCSRCLQCKDLLTSSVILKNSDHFWMIKFVNMNYCSQEDNIGYQEVKQYRTTVQCKKYLFFIGYTLFNSTTSTFLHIGPDHVKVNSRMKVNCGVVSQLLFCNWLYYGKLCTWWKVYWSILRITG